MYWEIVTLLLFGGGILLYAYARHGEFFRRLPSKTGQGMTSSEKLYISKTSDAAFFDGESEAYAEAMSRLRQYGGA